MWNVFGDGLCKNVSFSAFGSLQLAQRMLMYCSLTIMTSYPAWVNTSIMCLLGTGDAMQVL
jgi:hypothetical protein